MNNTIQLEETNNMHWLYQILRQSAHEGGKVVSPTHRPPLSPGYSFLLETVLFSNTSDSARYEH
jgi:hypothetical protein